MKHLLHFALALFVAFTFVGCDSADEGDNSAPTATADAVTAVEGVSVTIDVLANDTDPDGDDLTITEVSGASNGEAVIENGAIVYTPELGFSGQDSFTYTVSDGENTATGAVTVDVVLQLVGTWLSDGDDVAPGLMQLFGTTQVDAVFNANGSYTVNEQREGSPDQEYTGTYSVNATGFEDEDGNPIYEIVLDQATPTSLTSEGIYTVDADGDLVYEVIQTNPEIQGFTAPTAEAGFGSTAFNGTPLGPTWIQRYVPVAE
jgi:hypothetical protein